MKGTGKGSMHTRKMHREETRGRDIPPQTQVEGPPPAAYVVPFMRIMWMLDVESDVESRGIKLSKPSPTLPFRTPILPGDGNNQLCRGWNQVGREAYA